MSKKRAAPTTKDTETVAIIDVDAANRPYLDDELPFKETRGEKKRKATQLERLGESLITLAEPKLARVPLPDELRIAVMEARRIRAKASARGGYRRQIQLIGKIMRNVDAQPIADALESLKSEDAPSSTAFRAAEVWRDRLVSGTDADLDILVREHAAAHPDAEPLERTHLRQLVRQAQKETREKKPPHALRALFRELREAFLA